MCKSMKCAIIEKEKQQNISLVKQLQEEFEDIKEPIRIRISKNR